SAPLAGIRRGGCARPRVRRRRARRRGTCRRRPGIAGRRREIRLLGIRDGEGETSGRERDEEGRERRGAVIQASHLHSPHSGAGGGAPVAEPARPLPPPLFAGRVEGLARVPSSKGAPGGRLPAAVEVNVASKSPPALPFPSPSIAC